MFSKVVPRVASVGAKRVFTPSTVRPFSRVASLRNAEDFEAKQIPVVTFKEGERKERIIPVSEAADLQPVSHGADAQKHARPFDTSVLGRMTPTLQKFTLVGKVAVVTGGARGLGLNMAQALAEVGVKGLAILDVQPEVGEQAARDLSNDTGIDVRFYKVDVRDASAITQAVSDVVAHYGKIDVLINSAGIADSNIKAETYDTEMFRRLIDININGNFLVAQAVGREMIKADNGGSIIFIASMSGSIVNYPQEQCCYNASKAGVIQLTKSLAAEWARFGIRVNSISPGYMDTALNRVPALDAQKRIWVDQTPQKRLGSVDDLNNLAVYLASDGSAFMTGSNCIIDGGYTLW